MDTLFSGGDRLVFCILVELNIFTTYPKYCISVLSRYFNDLKYGYVFLTVFSSWRSCWLRFEDSCSLASRAAIFSSLISKDDFRVDSSLVSRSLNLKNIQVRSVCGSLYFLSAWVGKFR